MPLRLRQPPPDDVNPTTLDRNALVSREDCYRHYLAMRMYIRPVIRTTLSSVNYRFRSPVADQAAKTFVAGMAALDACWGPYDFATSDRIATSVQS
jgi:hypothetical protein